MKIRFIFKWYDMFIGAHWSKKRKVLFLCLLPMLVLEFNFSGLPRRWKGDQDFCDKCSKETKWLYQCEHCDGVYCEECYGDIMDDACLNCQSIGF